MEDRRTIVLRAIIESFITTAEPVGSGYLLEEYGLGVSSATIRNDMAWLEKEGLIYQPHTSAGRIPTDVGFRQYVDRIFETEKEFRVPASIVKELQTLTQMLAKDVQSRVEEKLYYAVSVLARMCNAISFATLPWRGTAYYLGLANVLKAPEFHDDPVKASTVIEILEDKENFMGFLKQLDVDEDIGVYIGKENILKEIQSCSLIATQYIVGEEYKGVIGLLGPKRMNYKFNIAVLNAVRNDI